MVQMTSTGDNAGEDLALVFLRSFSVENEEPYGVKEPALARRVLLRSGGIGSNENRWCAERHGRQKIKYRFAETI